LLDILYLLLDILYLLLDILYLLLDILYLLLDAVFDGLLSFMFVCYTSPLLLCSERKKQYNNVDSRIQFIVSLVN